MWPELLLRVLRGEAVDWKELVERHTPQRRCVGCNCRCVKGEFLLSQWNRKDEMHRCIACMEKKREAGTPFECMNCFEWKSASAFDDKNLQRYAHRVCTDCIEKRPCIACGVAKVQEDFTPTRDHQEPHTGYVQGLHDSTNRSRRWGSVSGSASR